MKRVIALQLALFTTTGCLAPLTSRLDTANARLETTGQQLAQVDAQLEQANQRLAEANAKLAKIESDLQETNKRLLSIQQVFKRIPGIGQASEPNRPGLAPVAEP